VTDVRLRPIDPADHEFVLDLNRRNVALLAPLDAPRLAQLQGWAARAAVIERDGARAGFVLTFGPGTPYDSANYEWFAQRFPEGFYYLDRIVLEPRFRRGGIGRAAYDELERDAAPYGRMVLEVNVQPPNEPSLRFHRARGYVDLAELGDERKRVVLMEKRLPEGAGGDTTESLRGSGQRSAASGGTT
jgi:predicted GNAT superfamily acetyltransferase